METVSHNNNNGLLLRAASKAAPKMLAAGQTGGQAGGTTAGGGEAEEGEGVHEPVAQPGLGRVEGEPSYHWPLLRRKNNHLLSIVLFYKPPTSILETASFNNNSLHISDYS